jgi:acyl-CoA synthetase (AMP-forming)/AMP-acid ligase II
VAEESCSVGGAGAVSASLGGVVEGASSFSERILRHATTQRQKRAVTVVDSDLEVAGQLTYGQLASRSRTLGAWLRSRGAAGEPVVVVLPTGLDFVAAFFGCLEAGSIVVPAAAPRTQAEAQRLVGIVDDCTPRLLLTTADRTERVSALLEGRGVHCVAIEHLDPGGDPAGPDRALAATGGDEPALIQYTSGSTSAPRGAVVSHGNLLANEAMIQRAFGITERDVVLSWLPIHHDMGLMGGLLGALYAGGESVLLSPNTFLRRPARWLEAIDRFHATLSGAPNFAYELCCQRIADTAAGRLDLRHWRVAFCGAEPVRAATLERFAAQFATAGFQAAAFLPCYGLAEATLMVTGGGGRRPVIAAFEPAALDAGRTIPHERGRALVGCGTVPPGLTVRTVDPQSRRPCPPGAIGEIWVAGPSVCRGYWQDPQTTEQTFGARLADGDGQRFLRTGDLGFFDQDNLFVTGRLKSSIIVHGRNHDAADLEWTASRSHGALRATGAAAFAVDDGAAEQVVIVQEAERSFKGEWEGVARAVRAAVAEAHEIRVHEVVLTHDRLPRTTSNKIQRFAVRRALADGSLEVVHRSVSTAVGPSAVVEVERGELRSKVATTAPSERRRVISDFVHEQIAILLGPEISDLDPSRPLQELGLASLTGVQLRDALGRGADLDLPATFALEQPTLEGIVQALAMGMNTDGRTAGVARDDSGRGGVHAGILDGELSSLLEEIEGLEEGETTARLYQGDRWS